MKPLYKEIGRQQQQQRHTDFRNAALDRLAWRVGFVGATDMSITLPICFDVQMPAESRLPKVGCKIPLYFIFN